MATPNADGLRSLQGELKDITTQECIDKTKECLDYKVPPDLVSKFTVKAHTEKVYDCSFSADGEHLATGGQEGFVFVHNVYTGMKTTMPVKVNFVMGVCLSPNAKMLVSGGMDNKITMTDISDGMKPVTKKEMAEGHSGYISRLAFLSATSLLSTSGDGLAITWDVATGTSNGIFKGHTGDCNSIGKSVECPNIFATGSTDKTCRLWDIRSGKTVRLYQANAEVNCVALHPSGCVLMTGNENGNHQLFDVGSNSNIDTGKPKNKKSRLLAICMSKTGRYTYLGTTAGQICACDTFCVNKWKMTAAHEKYVCAMSMSDDGACLATSSYDATAKVWTALDPKPAK